MKYVGNKNIPGVIELLINNLPKSKRYFSLFYGSGGLENSVYTADAKFICSEINPDCKIFETNTSRIEYFDYRILLDNFDFNGHDFIFADPPYTFCTRSSGRRYYGGYEWDLPEHIEFLNYMISMEAKVMLTHPMNDLYSTYLKNWNTTEFSYMTHRGKFNDCLWMNYNSSSIELLSYDCLGENFTERQAIKRQRRNMIEKFRKMDVHVRNKILKEIIKDVSFNCSI